MINEELNSRFAPLHAEGDTLPENGSMPEGSFYTWRKGVLRLLFLYTGGERRLLTTYPNMHKSLPPVEGLPDTVRLVVNTGSSLQEWIVKDGKWKKILEVT